MHPVLEQKQALPDARYYLQLALLPVAVHIEGPASLYTTQHAHQPFLDLVPFHDPTRQFFLTLRSRGQIFHWPPHSLCLGFTRLLQSLADLHHMPAKAGQSHAMARQVAHHPFRIADRPQRPSKHQSVEATQHSRNPLRMSCDKLVHGASLLPRCSVLAERQHLIENRSACHFWLRLSRAVLKPYELLTIWARWRSTTWLRAASRSWKLLGAPTNTMFAPGAIPCTASTSSVSSPYQPCGSCFIPRSG